MKLLKLSLLLFFYLLLFQSCKKDLFEVVPDTSVSRSLVVSRSFEDRGEDLVLDFYTDILELQTQTRFYDEFHQEYGFFNWSSSIEMQSSEGKLLIVPTQHDFRTSTTGQFLYFDSGTEQKMRFYSRAEIDNKIAQENVNTLTKEEVFVYRLFVANDLRNVENTEDVMSNINPEVIFRDGEDIQATEDCEGGSYEWVCVYHQGADLSIGINVEDYITTTDPRIRAYDGHSLQDLQDNYDNIVGGNGPGAGTGPGSIPWDLIPVFDQYLQERENLFNLHGIGNGPEGILEATVIEFIRECNWVWVWCWQDPADYGSILTGGGNSSSSSDSYLPAWQDNYNDLRFCEGVGDVQDTGQDNVNAIHPNFDFCSTWMDYLMECILPNQSETDTYEETIWQWAQFQYTNSDLFNQIIQNPDDCTSTDELDVDIPLEEDCLNALSNFEALIETTLNKFEKWAIFYPEDGSVVPCGDQALFNTWAIDQLIKLAESEDGNTIVEIDENNDLVDVTNSILPYSCLTFQNMEGILDNHYTISLDAWKPQFIEVGFLKYTKYTYNITFDIDVKYIPGEPKCEVQNLMAQALNQAIQATVLLFGENRMYKLPNSQAELEELFEGSLHTSFAQYFPLGVEAKVPKEWLYSDPLIPMNPFESDDCCDDE